MTRFMIPRVAHCNGGALVADPEGLAAFVAGLPDGDRHKGFFWAAMTAHEDGLDEDGLATVERAGLRAGLDQEYVDRTMREARERHGNG